MYTVANPTGGARAIFENNGVNIAQACDEKADGHSAVTQFSHNPSAGTVSSEIRNPKGNGKCAKDQYPPYVTRTQYMRACLADGGGAVFSCSGWKKVTFST